MSQTAFKPSVHGWPFANGFACSSVTAGLGRPLSASFGLCAGMCWAALDRYLARRRVPRPAEPPEPGEPLHEEFRLRQVNALAQGVWRRVADWQRRPDRSGFFGPSGLARLTRKKWRRVRKTLDAGQPVLLCLIRTRGEFADPSANRMVLAYRYARERGGRSKLWLYDPDRPDDDNVTLTARVRRGRALEGALAGGEDVRGFFAVPYDRERPLHVATEVFSDRTLIPMSQPVLEAPSVVLGRRGRIHLFGRSDACEAIHFHRRPGDHWDLENLSREKGVGEEHRLYGSPVAVAGSRGRLDVFGRSYVGDLIQLRRGPLRGWSARNLTDSRGVGLQFRIAGDPVALAGSGRGAPDVFARTSADHIVHYESSRGPGWRASDLTRALAKTGDFAVATAPVAATGADGAQHVLGRHAGGDLIHYVRSPSGSWKAENVSSAGSLGRRAAIAGDPVVASLPGGALDVFARDDAGDVWHFRRAAGARWGADNLTADAADASCRIAVEPAVAVGPDGSVHLFGHNDAGDLIHYRRMHGGDWSAENITADRPTVGEAFRIDGRPVAAVGPGTALHVAGRSGPDLVLYGWRPDSGWVAENLTRERRTAGDEYRLDDDPAIFTDGDGRPHLLGINPRGMVVHLAITEERPERAVRPGGRRTRSESRGRRGKQRARPKRRADSPAAARPAGSAQPAGSAGSAAAPKRRGRRHPPAPLPERSDREAALEGLPFMDVEESAADEPDSGAGGAGPAESDEGENAGGAAAAESDEGGNAGAAGGRSTQEAVPDGAGPVSSVADGGADDGDGGDAGERGDGDAGPSVLDDLDLPELTDAFLEDDDEGGKAPSDGWLELD